MYDLGNGCKVPEMMKCHFRMWKKLALWILSRDSFDGKCEGQYANQFCVCPKGVDSAMMSFSLKC